MSSLESKRFPAGHRLIARGPHRIKGTPDVDGEILSLRKDGRVLVQEKEWDTPTVVNPDGGWYSLEVTPAPAGVLLDGTKNKVWKE